MRHWTEETSWQRLGDIVAGLKLKVEAAVNAGDGFEADLAHQDLIDAECRLRMADRSKEKARQCANTPGLTATNKGKGDE